MTPLTKVTLYLTPGELAALVDAINAATWRASKQPRRDRDLEALAEKLRAEHLGVFGL